MHKDIIFREEARQKMLAGVKKLADAVRLTLGAKGRNVIMKQRYGSPLITNDGVTIAKEVMLENQFENMGADAVKEVASRTNDATGDGTTTAVILCHAIFKEGLKYISQGANAMSVKDGIMKATKLVVEELKKNAVKIKSKKQKEQVATISSQDKEVGKIVADMLEEIGDDGIITVEEGNKSEIETEIVQGMQLSTGWFSPYFVTDQATGKAEYKNVPILVTDCKLSNTMDIKNLLDKLVDSGKKKIIIFSADGIEGTMLIDLIKNKLAGMFSTLVVKVPGFGERKKDLLQDIAVATGATFISNDLGSKLEEMKIEDLGLAEKVVAERDKTIILTGKKDSVELGVRISQIKAEIKRNESDYEKEKLQERLARLTNGVGVIKVGAITETEQAHRHHRVEDSVEATKAAIEEGIIAGGGVALVEAVKALDGMFAKCVDVVSDKKGAFVFESLDDDEKIGFEIVKKALLIPARQIAENAGRDGGEIVAKIKDTGEGYNAQTNSFTNMIETGIIDPVKVTRSALENAASTASILLTTEAAITYEDNEQTK